MQRQQVDMCIVGTDRTLSNGDVCNKIGTYLKALAAYDNNVPFYVALPSSTIDWKIKDSKDIPIEERDPNELSNMDGMLGDIKIDNLLIYPKKSKALNLGFDITPAKYVKELINEILIAFDKNTDDYPILKSNPTRNDQFGFYGDPSSLYNDIKWKSSVSLIDGLNEMVNWIKKEKK